MVGKAFICNDVAGTFFKKHDCIDCKVRLIRKKVSKIVNSESEEAKNYSFRVHRNTLKGDVKFSWYEFECPNCKRCFTVAELDELECKN